MTELAAEALYIYMSWVEHKVVDGWDISSGPELVFDVSGTILSFMQ